MNRPRILSGVPGLDTILNGGFYQSGVYIIQGKPGTGKTILANQICFAHAKRGGKAAYVTLLTESIPRMFDNLSSMKFFDQSRSPEQIYYVSAFSILESEGLTGLMKLLRDEISTRNPSILVLDGMVSAAEKASSGLELRKFIHELQGYASLFPCTIFLLGTTDTEAAVRVEHTMVEGVIDLADTSTPTDFQRSMHISKFRGGSFIGGRHSFTISDAGTEIFPRLEATIRPTASLDTRPPLKTGLAGFDQISGIGGLRSSSCTLLSGPPGAGKTTFGAYFLSLANSEEPGLLFGFNESPAAVLSNADAHGIALSRVLEEGFLHAHWRPNVENLLDELGHRLIRLVEEHRARRVFIDGLSGFIASAIYPQRIDRFIAALTLELRRLGATSIFTVEACDGTGRLPPAVAGLPALFDNLIVLRTSELGLRVRRLLSVTKMRGCDFDQTLHAYSFEEEGMVVGSAVDDQPLGIDRDGTAALGREDDPA
jgi:circadian clock protein KaiC